MVRIHGEKIWSIGDNVEGGAGNSKGNVADVEGVERRTKLGKGDVGQNTVDVADGDGSWVLS